MKIEIIAWQDTLPLRQRVLWPDMPKTFCIVDGDELATHYGIYDGEELFGVASTYKSGRSVRLRKFAVAQEYQGQGHGSQLLKRIIELEAQAACRHFWCDARKTARGFYEQFGMSVEGEVFYKTGVPYFKMSIGL